MHQHAKLIPEAVAEREDDSRSVAGRERTAIRLRIENHRRDEKMNRISRRLDRHHRPAWARRESRRREDLAKRIVRMQRAKWRSGDVRMSRRQHPRLVHVTRFVGAAGW